MKVIDRGKKIKSTGKNREKYEFWIEILGFGQKLMILHPPRDGGIFEWNGLKMV